MIALASKWEELGNEQRTGTDGKPLMRVFR